MGEPIFFAILGQYPFNELGYDAHIETVHDAADHDRLEFETGAFDEAELLTWAEDEPRVEFASEPLVIAKATDVITTLQALCTAQGHDIAVMACTKPLCVDRRRVFFTEED